MGRVLSGSFEKESLKLVRKERRVVKKEGTVRGLFDVGVCPSCTVGVCPSCTFLLYSSYVHIDCF